MPLRLIRTEVQGILRKTIEVYVDWVNPSYALVLPMLEQIDSQLRVLPDPYSNPQVRKQIKALEKVRDNLLLEVDREGYREFEAREKAAKEASRAAVGGSDITASLYEEQVRDIVADAQETQRRFREGL